MLPLYLFALILGGGFLLVSLFGDALGTDVDGAHADLDGLDLDMDALHADVDVHTEFDGGAGGWSKLLSLRGAIYGLFGFGGVGTLLHVLRGGAQAGGTAAFAVVGGLLSGALITVLFNLVRESESGDRISEDAFRGLLGELTLPLKDGVGGQIVLTQGVRRIRLPARAHPAAEGVSPESWSRVMVVDMEKGVALVAPADPELLGGAAEEE